MIGMFVGNLHREVSLNGGRVTTLTLLLALCYSFKNKPWGSIFGLCQSVSNDISPFSKVVF